MASCTKTITSFDGTSIHVRIDGEEGYPVVFLSHPIGTDLHFWDDLTGELSGYFRVIRYDTRGHGQSDRPPGDYDIAMLGRDALAVLDHLGVTQVSFIGASLGGTCGMWLALNAPTRIRRLVIAHSVTYIPYKEVFTKIALDAQQVDGMSEIARSMVNNWLSPQFKINEPKLTQKLIDEMKLMSVLGFGGCLSALRDVDLREALKDIRVPSLVITGEEESQLLKDGAHQIAGGIPGARLSIIDRSAHLSSYENAAQFNKTVQEFLTE